MTSALKTRFLPEDFDGRASQLVQHIAQGDAARNVGLTDPLMFVFDMVKHLEKLAEKHEPGSSKFGHGYENDFSDPQARYVNLTNPGKEPAKGDMIEDTQATDPDQAIQIVMG